MTEFLPPKLIRGPHLQTVLSSLGWRRFRVQRNAGDFCSAAVDEIADCGNGVRLLVQHTPPLDADIRRTIVLFHGWEGSSNSTYLLATAAKFWVSGFRILRVNLRDHGPSHHLNRGLFHSRRLDEAIGAVRWIRERFTEDEFFLGGFSLGGNFCLRIAASAAAPDLRIKKVLAVCPVLDPVETMRALDHGWSGYRQYFIRKWRRSLSQKQAAFPEVYDFTELERFSSLGKMTEHFVVNHTEYPDLFTYLNGYAITGDYLKDLSVPSAVLLAGDDPVIPVAGVGRLARPKNLHIDVQPRGGHCGFLVDYQLSSWLDSWLMRVIGL